MTTKGSTVAVAYITPNYIKRFGRLCGVALVAAAFDGAEVANSKQGVGRLGDMEASANF